MCVTPRYLIGRLSCREDVGTSIPHPFVRFRHATFRRIPARVIHRSPPRHDHPQRWTCTPILVTLTESVYAPVLAGWVEEASMR